MKRHLEYERVNMLDNECEDCAICEYIEADLNDAMERLDNHLQIVSPYAVSQVIHRMGLLESEIAVVFEKTLAKLDNFSDTQ